MNPSLLLASTTRRRWMVQLVAQLVVLLQLITSNNPPVHAWTPGFHGPGGNGGGTSQQRKDNDLTARPVNATSVLLTLEGDWEDQVEQAMSWQEQQERLLKTMPQPGKKHNNKKKKTITTGSNGKQQKQQKVKFKRGLEQEWERFEKEQK